MAKKQRLKISLDTMAERFRENPSRYAKTYRDLALEYWEDEMIGDASLLAILHEIKNS